MTGPDQGLEARLLADLNGERGQGGEEAARAFIEEQGWNVQWTDDAAEAMKEDFRSELDRLQKHVGGKLTSAEVDRVLDAVPEGGGLPDMVERFGEEFKTRRSLDDREARSAFMAEVTEDAQRADDAPAPIDTGDEERDERVQRMADAIERSTGGD